MLGVIQKSHTIFKENNICKILAKSNFIQILYSYQSLALHGAPLQVVPQTAQTVDRTVCKTSVGSTKDNQNSIQETCPQTLEKGDVQFSSIYFGSSIVGVGSRLFVV